MAAAPNFRNPRPTAGRGLRTFAFGRRPCLPGFRSSRPRPVIPLCARAVPVQGQPILHRRLGDPHRLPRARDGARRPARTVDAGRSPAGGVRAAAHSSRSKTVRAPDAHRRGDEHGHLRNSGGRRPGNTRSARDAPAGERAAVHASGRFAAGTPYRADDPELLIWVLYTLANSAIVVYGNCGVLDDDFQDTFWRDYRVVGRLFGLRTKTCPPASARCASTETSAGRRHAGRLGLGPYAGARHRARPTRAACRAPAGGGGQLRDRRLAARAIRNEYGFFPLPPAWMRRALVAGGAEYVKRVVIPFVPARLRYVPPARAA